MVVAGNDVAVHGDADVVHAQHEMVGLQDGLGAGDPVGVLEQGDDVKRAGFFHRIVEARQRADVDHGIVPNRIESRGGCCPLYGDES